MKQLPRFIPALLASLILAPCIGWAQPSPDDLHPGLFLQGEAHQIPLPLAHTEVEGTVRGFVAHVKVTQVYVNPYKDVIEATYVFPLPELAAVTAMTMHVADRKIVAEIHERQEAERLYEKAKSRGHTAALMTQERPNIFTQKIGNIPPGHRVDVELIYDELLSYEEGVSSFVFPTVVGPRFVPGQPLDRPDHQPDSRISDTDRVADASRITPPALAKNEASAHRIDLELDVDPGLPIADISSPSHRLAIEKRTSQNAIVRIEHSDRVPNKDFILHIDVRGKQPAVAVLTHKSDDRDGYLTLAIQPPLRPAREQIAAKDLFFVVDNSGSMNGAPIEACKKLVRHALANMNPSDRFTIMRFSDAVSALSPTPLDNTPENVERGRAFIDGMHGMGGTQMLSGIRRALAGSPEPGRVRIVFFLTDGYIGNDDEILRAVQTDNRADARLFSLGVGSSVNRYLLSGMARLGRGAVEVVRYDQDPAPIVERFYRRIRNPVLTSISLDWSDLQVIEQTPEVTGDLYDGQPLLLHARYRQAGSAEVTLHGWVGGQSYEQSFSIALPKSADRPEIASIWARAKIREWMDEESVRPGRRQREITDLAIEHSLMSKYTAFVAIDQEVISRRQSEPVVPVSQRLPLPDGVSPLALGWLSRPHIPPGDPILTVKAPADAHRVTAYFPFGLVKNLSYDEIRDAWRGRFLVPAGIPDGIYTIIIGIELKDGRVVFRHESYHLDSHAEEFLTWFEDRAYFAGEPLEVLVDAIEPAAEVYVHCPELGWHRLNLDATDDGRKVDWMALLNIPAGTPAGQYEVRVVVRDRAGNRIEQWITVYVASGSKS